MRLTGAARRLQDRGEVYGRFVIAGSDAPDDAPGVLRWAQDGGAELTLIGPLPEGWPRHVHEHMTVHGLTLEGDDVSLLNAYVSRVTSQSLSFRTSTLVFDEATTPEARWNQVVYQTANLHEWLPEVGHKLSRWDEDERGRLQRLTLDWQPPPTRTIDLEGARLRLAPRMETEESYGPDWSLRTGLDFLVDVDEPLPLRELFERYAVPLLSLMALAADRPDDVIFERAIRTADGVGVTVWRSGGHAERREWLRGRAFLFAATDLDDVEAAVKRWFEAYADLGPVMATFGGTINEGSLFQPSRLIAVVTALDAYFRIRINPGKEKLLRKLKALRHHAEVPDETVGGSDRALELLTASRNYYAHLPDEPLYRFTRRNIEEGLVDSTRRATALMQACLLREVGFDPSQRRDLLEQHHKAWPLAVDVE